VAHRDRDEPAALRQTRHACDWQLEAAVRDNLAEASHAAGRQDEPTAALAQADALFAEIGQMTKAWSPEIWKLVDW